MGSALEAPVAVTKDGWAVPVISELVTHAAMSMGLVRMASVNAALGGMESTALLVGLEKSTFNLFMFLSLA